MKIMNTEHNPGPWLAFQTKSEVGSNYWRIRTAPPESGLLDTIGGYCGEANARLIVAAPDLLEALKDMLALIGEAGTENEKTWQPGQRWIFSQDKVSAKNRITQARAAIAKAEGKV